MKYITLLLFTTLFFSSAIAQKSPLHKKGWVDFNKNGKKDRYEDPSATIDDRVKDLIARMTMEEKTCQLATLYGSGRVLKDPLPTAQWKNEIWKDGIGNIDEEHNGLGKFKSAYSFPYAKHVETIHTIQKWFVENTRLGIPVDFTNEGIRGLCHDRATSFPAQCGQGATWDKSLIYKIGEIEAKEAIALGYTNIYSPILDIAQDPRWGRVVETYGEDPYLVGHLGKQMIMALQKNGVVSTVKHFAVYSVPVGGRDGGTRTDPHVAPREMKTLFLEPFRIAFQEAGALGVMSSYNDYDGVPVSGSPYFLTELLRRQWGFKGYVTTDSRALEMIHEKHHVAATMQDAVAQAINAGVNIRTDFSAPADFLLPLRQAVANGKISMQMLDTRVSEVLRVKFHLGLFDNPYIGSQQLAATIVHSKAHQEVALEAAHKSIVLLKNENNLLPLRKSLKSIAVIGPNADEVENLICRYGPANIPIQTIYQGIKKHLPNTQVNYAKGADIIGRHFPEDELLTFAPDTAEQEMLNAAIALAKKSELTVLVLGGSELTVREERSRTSLDLPKTQERLLEAICALGKPVVLVMVDGRAAAINYAQKNVPAIIHAWFPGEFGGTAVADVLFGDYNPGGKLAVTFPKSVGQIPYAFPFKPGSEASSKTSVWGSLYPFGYGLSYTTFGYSDLKISPEQQGPAGTVMVRCKIKNTGAVKGEEVVQLYLHEQYTSVITYTKVLRGFERIALNPGEEKEVSFLISNHDLGIWDINDHFSVEPGKFEVMVGSSSKDIRLKGTFDITDH